MLWFARAVHAQHLPLLAALALCISLIWQIGWFAGVAERFQVLATGADVPAVLAIGALVVAVWSGSTSHEDSVVESWDEANYR